MELGPLNSLSFKSKFAAQTNEKLHKTKSREETETPREFFATTVQLWQPPQAVVGSGQPCSPTSRMLCFVLYLGPWVLPWIIRIGPIGHLLQAFLIL